MHSRRRLPVLAGLLLFTLAATAQTTTQTATYSYNGNPVSIPRDSADLAAVAEIFVPTAIRIDTVTAQVVVDYPAVGDLEIFLVSAQGNRIDLVNKDCGGLVNVNTTFADSGPADFDDFCPVEPGRGPFRPDEALSNLRGEVSAGYWNLYVVNDESDSRTGAIRAFGLTISGTRITTPSFSADLITNAAREGGGVIAPGLLVSLYGVAIGPEQAVTASGLPLPTTLGGTSVLVNGNPAPILYVSPLRVDFQAPFNLEPGTVANVEVRTAAGNSQSIPIEVVTAFAGIYTAQTNGRGQAVALNQDGSVNSSARPAPRGSFVSLYANGLGPVNPAATAGEAAPTNPLAQVSDLGVLVGGAFARVTYAGLAPGLVGAYQVNFQVPQNVASGARSIVLLPARGYQSQSRTYIFVE